MECLKQEQELLVIDEPVDPNLELAEIQRRMAIRQGPALLFTHVSGTEFRVATNLFGTRRRIDLAFGEEPYRFFKRVVEAMEIFAAPSISKLWNLRDLAKTGLRLGTAVCRSGPVLERVMAPARLTALPLIKCWPMDGGPFLTLPLCYTEHPLS